MNFWLNLTSIDVEYIIVSFLSFDEFMYYKQSRYNQSQISPMEFIRRYKPCLPTIDRAIVAGRLDIVQYLYSKQQKLKQRYSKAFFKQAIELAAQHGHLEILQFLYRDADYKGNEAICLAAVNGHLPDVEFLFQIGGNVNDFGIKTMNIAAARGHLQVVKFLYNVGAQFNSYAIEWAVHNGRLNVVQFLYSVGLYCKPSARRCAALNGHIAVDEFLQSFHSTESPPIRSEYV
jgi:hypothetical protein